MLIPAHVLEFGRALNEDNLPDTCVATVPGEWTPNGKGGGTYTTTTVTFRCRTWALSQRELETLVADQEREPGLEGMAMPWGQALPSNATLTITRAKDGTTQTYTVKGRVPDPTFGVMSKAIIQRVDP